MSSMNKRERLEATVAGEPVDRVAVALWRHWPGDDQRAEDLARSKRVARYAGMREALKAHDEDCEGCPGSEALRQVVEAN